MLIIICERNPKIGQVLIFLGSWPDDYYVQVCIDHSNWEPFQGRWSAMAHLLGPLLFHHPVGVGCWACVCMVLRLPIIFSITLHFFLWKPIMILWQILYKILHLLMRCVQDNNNILSSKSWECRWSECYLFFPLSSICAFDFTKLGSRWFHGWWNLDFTKVLNFLNCDIYFDQFLLCKLQQSGALSRKFSAHDSWICEKNQGEKRFGYMLIWQMCNKKVWKEFLEESFLNTPPLSPCFSICRTP